MSDLVGFITKSGSVYYVDNINRCISGGRLPMPFTYLYCENTLIGQRPVFYLCDGRRLQTSTIVQYI